MFFGRHDVVAILVLSTISPSSTDTVQCTVYTVQYNTLQYTIALTRDVDDINFS